MTAASGLLFGLDPGRARHRRAGGRIAALAGAIVDGQPWRSAALRRVLVGSQFAIATPLLVVAGLLLVSLNELRQVDLGFDTRNVLTGVDSVCRPRSIRSPAASRRSGTSSSGASRRCPA